MAPSLALLAGDVSIGHNPFTNDTQVLLGIKETKGLSLEEIDLLWATPEFREKNKDARIIEEMSVTQSNDESMKDEYDKSSA